MAIKRKEASRLSNDEQNNVNKYENIVDDRIRPVYQEGTTITVDYDEFGEPTPREISELVKRFEAAGWTVKVDKHQLEGSYLQFS